jgi:hypothetical protein
MFLILIRSASVLLFFGTTLLLMFNPPLVSVVAGHKESWAPAPAREEEVWPGAARRPPPHTTPQERSSRHQWRGRQRSVFHNLKGYFTLSSIWIWIWIRNYRFVSGFRTTEVGNIVETSFRIEYYHILYQCCGSVSKRILSLTLCRSGSVLFFLYRVADLNPKGSFHYSLPIWIWIRNYGTVSLWFRIQIWIRDANPDPKMMTERENAHKNDHKIR